MLIPNKNGIDASHLTTGADFNAAIISATLAPGLNAEPPVQLLWNVHHFCSTPKWKIPKVMLARNVRIITHRIILNAFGLLEKMISIIPNAMAT